MKRVFFSIIKKTEQKVQSLKNILINPKDKINLPFLIILTTLLISYQFLSMQAREKYIYHKFPYKSFSKFTASFKIIKSKKKTTPKITITSYGSSIVVITNKKKSYSILLTAEHVCNPKMFEQMLSDQDLAILEYKKEHYITDYFGNSRKSEIIFKDAVSDLCLVKVEGVWAKALKISDVKPKMGEKVYNIASPAGFFAPGMVPLLEGRYSGEVNVRQAIHSMYSIPATHGSSGSPILNYDGKIVGIIHSALRRYENMAIACSLDDLKLFIKNYKKSKIKKIRTKNQYNIDLRRYLFH